MKRPEDGRSGGNASKLICCVNCPLSPEMIAGKSFHQIGRGRDHFGGEDGVRGNAVKHCESAKTVDCEIVRHKSPSLREGRALRPGEGVTGGHHLIAL